MKQTIAALLLFASLTPAATRGWQAGESSAREARFRLSVGNTHACVVPYDGTVRCWGQNDSGQLGNGTTTDSATPVTVRVGDALNSRPLRGVVAVAAGINAFTCALTAEGKVFCWGRDIIGQLGNGVFNPPGNPVPQPFAAPVTAFTGAVRISAGVNGACALLADGTTRCWGEQTLNSTPGPNNVAGLASAIDLAPGLSHACFLVAGGGVRCRGKNNFGQLGNGTTTASPANLVTVNNLSEATVIASSDDATCAVVLQGQIRCWGSNANGELGIGISAAPFLSSPSTPVFQINDAVSVEGSRDGFCALTASGLVKCWGGGNFNGLPAQFGVSQIVAVSKGASDGRCVLSADGTVACQGFFVSGNFPGLAGSVSAKAVATGSHSCAVRANGTVACWGDNGADAALLGNGTGPAVVPNPTTVAGLANVTAVTVGVEHSCVLIADGTVKCWGRNSRGQIGNSTAVDQPLPVPLPNLQKVVAIQAGSFHTCAIQVDGNTFCWGANESGQLAINGDLGDRRQPNLVLVSNIVSIATGRAHTCGVRADANMFCWGAGAFGQIGNGGATAVNTVAVQVPGFTSNALAVSSGAGADHSCAVDGAGALRCWGRNDRGQIGLGSTGGNVPAPTVVPGLPAIANMTAEGASHTCAARTDGLLSCWGGNAQGQLGLGSVTFRNQPAPVDVTGAGTVAAIAAGVNTTCSLSPLGGLDCWGNNASGQVGNGTSGNQVPLPTDVPSFTLNIVPTVLLSSTNPRKLTVNIVANCEFGDQLKLRVQVRQAATGAAGHGNETTRCTGGMATFPVEIQAQGGTPFSPGAATVEADAEIRGVERTTQSWTRAVNIVAQ